MRFLITKYTNTTPTFQYVRNMLFGCDTFNYKYDHAAIRCFDMKSNVAFFKNKKFIQQKDTFHFPQHNASAIWMKNSDNVVERIFISQYDGHEKDKKILSSGIDLDLLNFYIKNGSYKMEYSFYNKLHDINPYLAWTLLNRDYINHLTFKINNIETFIDELSKNKNVQINNPHNPIQISKDGLLLQASTKADMIKHTFVDDVQWIPGSFVEFIERRVNPDTQQERDGFEQENANVIFSSTQK